MSRSRKHTPIIGMTTAESEKADKLAAHRRERRLVRKVLGTDPEREVLPHTREVSNVATWDKDGKVYMGVSISPKGWRK